MFYLGMPLNYMNTFEVELKVYCSYLPLGVTLHLHLHPSLSSQGLLDRPQTNSEMQILSSVHIGE